MKYYLVTSAFYDNGRSTAAITETRECESKPENTFTYFKNKGVYNDWFDSLEDAQQFVVDCQNA